MDEKTCTQCGTTKPLDQFHRMATGRDGRRSECAACSCARMQRTYDEKIRPNHDTGPLRLTCRHCSSPFEYVKTTGRRRYWCSEKCKHQAGEAAKKEKANGKAPARMCACGSTDVARVGKPVCPGCRRDKRDPAVAAARERRRTLRKYGLTEADWAALIAEQGDRCAICRTDTPGGRGQLWHIDHDHKTNEVRGLLCHHCNVGIGNFRDDPQLLLAVIRYLGFETRGLIWKQEPLNLGKAS